MYATTGRDYLTRYQMMLRGKAGAEDWRKLEKELVRKIRELHAATILPSPSEQLVDEMQKAKALLRRIDGVMSEIEAA